MAQTDNQTPLTEQQARALAHWWGGRYEKIMLPGTAALVWHCVILPGRPASLPYDHSAGLARVSSREEAQEMENRRGFQEACSPDWLG